MYMFHWYGLFIGIAIVVGWSVAERIEPKVSKVAPWVIICGFLGARIYHVIDLWSYYSQNFGQVFAVWNGGLSIWGAIGGGAIGIVIYHYTIRPLDQLGNMLGAMITPLPLAQAIGRVGNGVNGEFTNLVLGIPWWGMEALLDLALFGLVWRVEKKWRVGVYLVGYGLIRLVLQPYR